MRIGSGLVPGEWWMEGKVTGWGGGLITQLTCTMHSLFGDFRRQLDDLLFSMPCE